MAEFSTQSIEVMLTSIKLLNSSEINSFNKQKQREYCQTLSGICGNSLHHNNGEHPRLIFTIEQFYQSHKENDKLFVNVLSIDLSGLKITINLLKKLREVCPKVECFFLNDTLFDFGSWTIFNEYFSGKMVDLSIDNLIRIYMDNGDEFIRASFNLVKFNKLKELKLTLKDKGFNPYHLNEYCKQLPKTLVYIYFDDQLSDGCDLNCGCSDIQVNNVNDNVHNSLAHEFNRTFIQCQSLEYYRLETGVCPEYSQQIFADIGQHSGQLKALNLTLKHKKFDGLVNNNQLIRSKYSEQLEKLQSIELLALSLGKQLSVQLAINLDDQDFLRGIKTLRLIGTDVADCWTKKLMAKFVPPKLEYFTDCEKANTDSDLKVEPQFS